MMGGWLTPLRHRPPPRCYVPTPSDLGNAEQPCRQYNSVAARVSLLGFLSNTTMVRKSSKSAGVVEMVDAEAWQASGLTPVWVELRAGFARARSAAQRIPPPAPPSSCSLIVAERQCHYLPELRVAYEPR